MRSDLERNLKKFQQNTPQATPAAAPASYQPERASYPATFDEYLAQRNAQRQQPTYPATFDEYLAQREQQKQEDEQRRREEERQKCLDASGFIQMQSDMSTMFGGMDAYLSQTKRKDVGKGRLQQVQGMLDAVEQEKDYFNRYADVLGDTTDYQAALEQWEQQLKGYEAALGRKRTLTPEQTPQELLTDNPLTGKKLGAALTGLQNPLTPVDTNEDGQPDTLQMGYTLGNRRLTQRGEELSGLLQQKAKRADWNNQTVQDHEKYIRESFENLKQLTDRGTTTETAKNLQGNILNEVAERLSYLAYSGKCTEEEYEKLVTEVEKLKKDYLKSIRSDTSRLPGNTEGNPYLEISAAADRIQNRADAMKEFRYQNSNLTRENIAYQPVDKLLDRMHFTYSKDENWGSSSAERAAVTFMGEEVLPEYLANTEMTQEQYDRFLERIKGTPNEAALRRMRESNGLNANEEGKRAALEKYREIDGQTYMDMFEAGSEGAMHNVMEKYPGGAEQVLTRGLGYITKFTGEALNMFGSAENAVGNWFKEGGQKGIDYVNEDWQEGKQREYNEGRYASDLLQNGNKFEKWTAGMTRELTQAALEMASAGAIAGQISAGNTALAQLSQGGKYASSLANAQKHATGYMKFTAQMAELMKNSSNIIISANAALNSYGEAEDAGMGAGGRAIKLIAGGLIEYYTNGLFGGNPVVDPDGAGAVAKKIYELTDNETIRKIVSSKIFDRVGEGLEEVTSAIAGAALDYALTGETSLSAEELVNEFTVGVLLSLVMSAPEDVVDAVARAKNSIQSKVVTKFGKDAQTNLETLYGTMVNYTMKDLAGDESMMRLAGWSDSQIKKAKSEWQTVVREFNTLANRLEGNQSVSDSFTPYTPPEGYANNAFEDVEYMNAIRANQASDAALMTDRALDIATIQQRMQIESLRNSTDAGDIFQAENAQSYLDILDRERSYRQAERAQTAQEAAEWNEASTTQAAQESTNNETAIKNTPVEPVQEEEAAAPTAQANEGGTVNESNGQGEERTARVDSAGEAVTVERKPERANDAGAGEGRTGNLSEAARRGKLEERVKRFSEVAQDKPVSDLMSNGDPDALVGVIPVRKYTKEMQQMQRAVKSHGLKLTFVKGTLSIQAKNGEYINANGAYDEETGRIFASVSSAGYEPEQIAQHELYHALIAKGEANVVHTLQLLRNEFSDEQLMEIAREYEKLYFGVYDSAADVWEEIFADAYSGMNRFGTGKIYQLQRTVAESTPEVDISEPAAEISAATRRTQDSDGNKKAGTKASMAGPKAKTASSKNLALAEAMEEDGASREEIWKRTGWLRGSDGQWRFEIDDSNSEFRPNGDAKLLNESGYRRLVELTDKWGDSFEKGGEALSEAEEAEMERLQEEYSDRVWEKKYELQDFLKHDDLYEAYPLLRHTTLRFEKLDPGVKGKFNKRDNSIVLSDSLFGKGPETILHEIQHIIQKYEGFQGGTSPEYWARKDYESGDKVQERLQRQYSDILNGLTKSEQNIRYQEIDGELERLFYSQKPEDTAKYDRMDAEHDRLYAKLYENEWFGKLLDLKRQMENPGEVYLRQYKNSAGEIEARETASRRKLTAEERKNKMPDLGWDRALLTEDTGDAKDAVLDGRLTADSTEQERYELLKNETLTLASPNESKLSDIDLADFNTRKKSAVMTGMKALAKKLGIMNVDLKNSRIEIPFQFSNKGLTTSLHHQLEYGGSYQDYAKMMTCFNELIRNAVPIEIHGEKKAGTSKENPDLKRVYVLLGGYVDANAVVPVEFEVKEFANRNNGLYLSVVLTKIAPEVLEKGLSAKSGSMPSLFSGAEISIADIFRNVNSEDGRFLKYVPDGFLSAAQKKAKQAALAKQEAEYAQYGRNDKLTTIRNLNEDDLEAMYGAARIPVKELLTDTEGEGDVSLIVKNEDARNNKAHLEHMAAVIPTSADGWLVEKLEMNGLNVVVYESGNEAARKEAETKAEKLLEEPTTKFSLSPEEKVQRAENKLTAAQEKLEKEQAAAQKRYKSDLTGGLKRLFNIQSYDNEKLNALLETPMQMMQQNVNLLSPEKADLFEALMDLGTETIPADDYYKDIRADLKERKIYVPESVRAEFGDDWQDFYKRAFGRHKIYLTRNEADRGADVHMQELAEMYPGTFTETTDTAEMLRQMVDAADKGMDAKLSWREAAKENEKRYGLKQADQIEYQKANFLNLLNTYAEKAGKTAREAQATTETDERLASLIREADGEKDSVKKAEGPVEPWTISEAAAQKRGFPNLNGRQVYPLRTWVRAADMGNYGLVLDKSTKKGKLTVLFQNKETGLASIKDIDTKDLMAVDATYQPSVQETVSLLASLPAETLEDAADAQDVAEFYEWYDGRARLADAEEKARTRAAAEQERKDSIVREEEKAEARKQERLEGVRKAYLESFGTSEPELPYGKGKPLNSRGTTLQPAEALALLQAMTGKKWTLTNKANGTWKATITKEDAPKSSIQPKDALEKLQASRKNYSDFAETAVRPEGVPKEAFEGSPAMQEAGIKIDGGIAEYSQVKQMRNGAETRRSIQRQIEKTKKRLEAKPVEIRAAKKIASGRSEYYKLPDNCRPEVVSQLSALYLNERMTGEDLIQIRKGEIRAALLYKMIDLFPTEKEIQANPELFKPEKLLVLNYRTALRSMINIFGEERGMEIYNYLFAPVIRNTAESYRWENKQFDAVREFEDSKGKKSGLNQTERSYVHMMLDVMGYVEQANDSDRSADLKATAENVAKGASASDQAIEFGLSSEEAKIVEKYAQWINGKDAEGIDKVKCENAMKEYRKLFDLYFEAVNDFLVAHGMQPIGKIKGYTPHIPLAEKFNLMSKAMELLGMNEYVTTLPAEIAGRTETFRPQKRWNPFFLERKTDKTAYDIEEAFQRYVQYLGDIFFHTDDIQKVRAAESYLRQGLKGNFDVTLEKALDMSRSGDIEEKVEYLQEMGKLDNDMRDYSQGELAEAFDRLISELIGEAQNSTRYSDLVVWLKNYGDILAGKQFGGDRGTEYGGGREWLNIGNKLVGAFAKANVAGNLSSVLNQSAQLAMLQATRSQRAILKASWEFGTGKLGEFRKEIDFLTGKKGIDYLVQNKTDKIVSGMFAPAEFMDSMLSTIATRAAYWDAIQNGKSEAEALRYADWYGRALMGDRTKGAKPLAFHSKGLVRQMVNVFQIEALNTVEFTSKDMPLEIRREAEKNGRASAARMLLRTIVGYLIAAFVLNRLTDELYGGTPAPLDIAGLTANFFASGKGLSTNDYIRSLINKVVGSKIFDVPEENEKFDTSAALEDTGYNVLNEIPFASNISSFFGVGDRTLPFPNLYGTGKNFVNAIFPGEGKNANGQEVLEKGLEFLAELVPGGRQAKKTGYGIKALLEGGKTKGYGDNRRLQYSLDMDNPMTYVKALLFGVNSTSEAKAYYAANSSGLTADQTKLWMELRDEGVNGFALYGLMMRMDDAMNYSDIPDAKDDETEADKAKRLQMKEEKRKAARAELLKQEGLTDGQRMRIYSEMVSSYNDDQIEKLISAGMKWKDVSDILDKRGELSTGAKASEWAAEFANWVDKKGYSDSRKEAIQEAFGSDSANFYNKMSAAGVSPDNALKVEKQARKLAGENDLSQKYKAQAIAESNLTDKEAYAALSAVYTSSGETLTAAQEAGIPGTVYAEFREKESELSADKDENGKTISDSKKEKVIDLIDSLNLTAEQKDFLMEQQYKSFKWWQMPWN
jgi:hypothetical protein